MKILAQNKITSASDLAQRKQLLRAYIHAEEQKEYGLFPAVSNPLVTKVAGIAGAFILKALLKRVLK